MGLRMALDSHSIHGKAKQQRHKVEDEGSKHGDGHNSEHEGSNDHHKDN